MGPFHGRGGRADGSEAGPRKIRRGPPGSVAAAALLLFGALSVIACNIELASNDPPRRARVVVTGAAGAQANLLASLNFVVEPGGGVNTGGATPSLVTLPFDQNYDLLDPPRLFIRITPPDTLTTMGVSLEVYFDGERFTAQSDSIGTAERPAIEFMYRYSRPTL